MKKIIAVVLSLSLLCVMLAFSVNAGYKSLDLIDGTNTVEEPNNKAYFKDGVFTMEKIDNVAYQSTIHTVGLTESFKLVGTLKIVDVTATADNDISIWNGIRIIFGRTDAAQYNTVSLYRKVGIQIVNHSTTGVGDIFPYPSGVEFANGNELPFELIKSGNDVTFTLSGNKIFTRTLTDGEVFFTDGIETNIGFISINTAFEVKDLSLYNEGEDEVTTVPEETEPEEDKPTSPVTSDSALVTVIATVCAVICAAAVIAKRIKI